MKPFWKSKTLWLNALAIGAAWLLGHQGVMADVGIGADVQLIILAVANMIVRCYTNTGVTGS